MSQLSIKSGQFIKQRLDKVYDLKSWFVSILTVSWMRLLISTFLKFCLDVSSNLNLDLEWSWQFKILRLNCQKSLKWSINKVSTSLNKVNALKPQFALIFNNISIETLDLNFFKTLFDMSRNLDLDLDRSRQSRPT